MSSSEASQRFHVSQRIGYEQWHDGVGYDMEAYATMTPEERDAAAAVVRAKSHPDWRDLEVLGAHRSAASVTRLRELLAHALGELIDAGQTPGSVADVQLAHVIDAVTDDDGFTAALLLASAHAGPLTKLALLRGAQLRPAVALHFAAALLDLAGLSRDDPAFDPRFRPVLLRLLPDNPKADRVAAFRQLCGWLNLDPDGIPEPGSGADRAWAERHEIG